MVGRPIALKVSIRQLGDKICYLRHIRPEGITTIISMLLMECLVQSRSENTAKPPDARRLWLARGRVRLAAPACPPRRLPDASRGSGPGAVMAGPWSRSHLALRERSLLASYGDGRSAPGFGPSGSAPSSIARTMSSSALVWSPAIPSMAAMRATALTAMVSSTVPSAKA